MDGIEYGFGGNMLKTKLNSATGNAPLLAAATGIGGQCRVTLKFVTVPRNM